ncbi:MAG: aldehyde ferredoxin oxidoreductase family protein [Candidatus Bathyarchaeota archaeon]|nr:MAG: aldehyde ferredoxin oxidoreductase family protein [Candidatus Bathyarchaeota archaeon]UCE57461.1 MAG: aldehyde ferredoxin oxidoreductase family protein [Candidatus Bathyarchaeota archaeon]
MYGWHGKILRINLTDEGVKEEVLSENFANLFLGGRGIGVKILHDELKPKIDPLSPENKLVFGSGPLTGTGAPTSGRCCVVTKSPLTGTIFDSHSGGHFGIQMKRTGYDFIVIEGKSRRSSYVWINNNAVEILSASNIWGLNTHKATDSLLLKTNSRAKVACIGPAGENQVLISCIVNDRNRAFGRGGMGAVMGSKNLKAIVVYGSKKTSVADKEKFENARKKGLEAIRKNPITKDGLPTYGTAVLVNIINEIGAFPTNNFQKGHFQDADAISGETIRERILEKKVTCGSCSIACGRATKIQETNRSGEGPEYETVWALGASCGVKDLEAITEANYLCNELGLDTISTGSTIACAMELCEKGYLPRKMRFGDGKKVIRLVKKIAEKEGIGEDLSRGSYRLAKEHGCEELSMSVKKLEMPAYDPRGLQGMGLAYATSSRGACHLRAYTTSFEVLGAPCLVDRFKTEGKPELTILFQNISAAIDSMILCKFSQLALNPNIYADLLEAVTGEMFTGHRIITTGERIYNLERVWNVREGFGRKDDTLPKRLLETPLIEGHSKNKVVNLEPMIDEFYKLRGWSVEGIPTLGTLADLKLYEARKFVEELFTI